MGQVGCDVQMLKSTLAGNSLGQRPAWLGLGCLGRDERAKALSLLAGKRPRVGEQESRVALERVG